MRHPTLSVLCALALTAVAKADRFWLETVEGQRVEGSAPAVVDGVVIDQDAKQYHVRVVGGELWLDKQRVVKVEKDGLTVAQIEQQEAKQRDAAKANARAVDASAKAAKPAAANASAKPAAAPAPAVEEKKPVLVFDPVIGALRPARELPTQDLKRELELAYELTGNRDYIKLLRKLRRMH